jgi:hypothetical protein
MVNTRRTSSGSDHQEQNNQSTGQPLLMPPPLTPEKFLCGRLGLDAEEEAE